jgi:hypothetical protein
LSIFQNDDRKRTLLPLDVKTRAAAHSSAAFASSVVKGDVMHEIRAVVTGAITLASMLVVGCGSEAGQAEPIGSGAHELRVERYRYKGEELKVTLELRPEGPRMVDGPDNARVGELLTIPNAGVLIDPEDHTLAWLYFTTAESDALRAQIRARVPLRHLDELPPQGQPSAQTDSLSGKVRAAIGQTGTVVGGCYVPGATIYAANNYGGASLFASGGFRDLREQNFDNVTSSARMWGGGLNLYEDPVWGGHSAGLLSQYEIKLSTCPYSQTFGEYPALSQWVMTSWLFWTTSWNDQTSSTMFVPGL